MSTPDVLTAFEHCERKGFWYRDGYRAQKLQSSELLQLAISDAMLTAREDHGIYAGERVMELAEERGVDFGQISGLHDAILHHAALADIVSDAIRRPRSPAWTRPEPVEDELGVWRPAALLGPDKTLRRVIVVSRWTEERHYAEICGYHGWGEICTLNLPMQAVVVVVGDMRSGRRHSPWTKGLLHPKNHELRFKKRVASETTTFSDSWQKINREDHDQISNARWLQAMLTDDVMRDCLLMVNVPVPQPETVSKVRFIVWQNRKSLLDIKTLPGAKLSRCEKPPCPFRKCCWSQPEMTPADLSMVQLAT